jgi:hypothetical protein
MRTQARHAGSVKEQELPESRGAPHEGGTHPCLLPPFLPRPPNLIPRARLAPHTGRLDSANPVSDLCARILAPPGPPHEHNAWSNGAGAGRPLPTAGSRAAGQPGVHGPLCTSHGRPHQPPSHLPQAQGGMPGAGPVLKWRRPVSVFCLAGPENGPLLPKLAAGRAAANHQDQRGAGDGAPSPAGPAGAGASGGGSRRCGGDPPADVSLVVLSRQMPLALSLSI